MDKQEKPKVPRRRKVAVLDKASPVEPTVQSEPVDPVDPPKKLPGKRALITAPNKKLTTSCKPVTEITDSIRQLAQEMEDFLKNPPPMDVRPIGIAAPQLGECVRMFSGMLNPHATASNDYQVITIVNPILVYEKKMYLAHESCMSLPKRKFILKRGKIVKIHGELLNGKRVSIKQHGIVAQMFMHELNHLDGKLLNEIAKEAPR